MRTVFSGLIIFVLMWFAVTNATPININAFFWNISVSTAIVVFVTFVFGFVFGVLRVAPSWFRKNSQAGKHQRDLNTCLENSKEQEERIRELELQLATERKKLQQHEQSDAVH